MLGTGGWLDFCGALSVLKSQGGSDPGLRGLRPGLWLTRSFGAEETSDAVESGILAA